MVKDPRLTQDLNLLDALTRRPVLENVWYNDKTVYLDGYNFISCRFDNCKLHIASEHFEMQRCFVDDNTTIFYLGSIIKVLRLFNCKYQWVYSHLPYFAPVQHSDGTITITTDPG